MINEKGAECFLEKYFDEDNPISGYIDRDKLAATFWDYCESDLYEWFKDNAKSFFKPHGEIDWQAVAKKLD